MLDIEDELALENYLRETGRVAAESPLSMQVLRGGVSNRTVLVRSDDCELFVLKQALHKLRVNVDWFSGPARIHTEAQGMRWLAALAPDGAVPRLLFEDREHYLLAMTPVPSPHQNWKTMLLKGQIDQRHVDAFGQLLGAIHRNAWMQRAELESVFEDRTYFESLRVEPFYTYTAEQIGSAADFYRDLIADTRQCRLTLVHGDYSPKNILVRDDQLVLLDHEVIHFGDPAFDLGFSMAHLFSKAHYLPAYRNAFASAILRYWNSYSKALSDAPWQEALEERAVRHTLGCLLARVSGRSTVEYLDPSQRQVQLSTVTAMMPRPPATISGLAEQFLSRLS